MTTAHGVVETPAFMPVGTRGAVKAVTQRDLGELGASIILGNTYHLYLRPGDQVIAELGGLHRFMGWTASILTDSGGYQVFSLAPTRRVTDEGVTFQSHLDGRTHLLTPEVASDIQARLGSDIAMVLDECIAYPASREEAHAAMTRTLRWARRARERFESVRHGANRAMMSTPGQAQFGIVQGGVFHDLREESARATCAMNFEAYAIGGLSVGEPIETMYEIVGATTPLLPEERPRYLMGTGMPDDLVESVARGIDLFDCVLPTRNARNGQLFTKRGPLNVKNARYVTDDRPIEADCACATCRSHSRAYLRHLFLSQEMTASTLNTVHNLHFYLDTMERIRKAIMFGTFEAFRQEFHRTFSRRSLLHDIDE